MEAAGECQKTKIVVFSRGKIRKIPNLLFGPKLLNVVDNYTYLGLTERLHLKFCKYILYLNKCTYTNMVYGETGEIPLSLRVKCRIVKYWSRLITCQSKKLSYFMYMFIYMFNNTILQRLRDQFIQQWNSDINNSPKSLNFRMFKLNFKRENYLISLPAALRIPLCKFKCRNHKLPT